MVSNLGKDARSSGSSGPPFSCCFLRTAETIASMAYRALLRPTASATEWLSATTLHPTYFPYPLTLVLHAVRISHAYSSKVKASGHKLPPFQHLAGFLVMVSACAVHRVGSPPGLVALFACPSVASQADNSDL